MQRRKRAQDDEVERAAGPVEPEEGAGKLYVIQKHQARRLHYDLRLECGGVLLSWAVPKGPSLNPADKRLAVRVEDHPLGYAEFEGSVPEDEYGAGTVMVWDTGTFENLKDLPVREAVEQGHIEFRLHGRKLKGVWRLVRMKWQGEENWLLVKKDDQWADRHSDVTETMPDSALTGRSMEEIAGEAWEER
jgi:bifunctional non-homologous end joining protein LigD